MLEVGVLSLQVDVNALRYCAGERCPLYTGGCKYIEVLCWMKLSSLYRWM